MPKKEKNNKRRPRMQNVYDFLKRRLNPPRISILILSIILWVFGVCCYFCQPEIPNLAIWPLIFSTLLLFFGSILEQI